MSLAAHPETIQLEVLQGGAGPLSDARRAAVSRLTSLVRTMSDQEADVLVALVEEFRRDGYLRRARPLDLPVAKILAEVINGWDLDGVAEFAGAWVSTLVAREDGFDWEKATEIDRAEHGRRIEAELARRGL